MAGRPTKYEGDVTIQKVDAIIEAMSQDNAAESFFSFCGIEQIADVLEVHRDTIYEWKNTYPEFSYTIKRWETKRNALFYRLVTSPQIQASRWIFLAKNWLGMSDRQEIEHVGGLDNKLTVEVIEVKSENPTDEHQDQ